MNNNLVLITFTFIFIKLICCYDKPLVNYIEPLTINDNKLSIYGRFFGNKIEDIKIEIDNKSYNITKWSNSSLIITLQPPNPVKSKIKITTPTGSVKYNVEFMNPYCLGINNLCNGHGVCVKNNTECLCNEPFSGKFCSEISGESMLFEMNNFKEYHKTSNKLQVFQIPITVNNLNNSFGFLEFNSSIGLVLSETSINGLVLNTYLITPSLQFGSIKGNALQVYRYRTNTLISSSDNSFNCDITLTHYQYNQTKSIYNQYIEEIKDSFALGVIINNFIPSSPTNKLTLKIYPLLKSKFGGKLNTTIYNNTESGNYDNINGTKSIKMSIGSQKLNVNLYDFGFYSYKFSTFNSSIVEIYNNTIPITDNEIYSILEITSNANSKYTYFNADFYPHLEETNKIEDKLTLFSDEVSNKSEEKDTKNIIDNNNYEDSDSVKLIENNSNSNYKKNNPIIDDGEDKKNCGNSPKSTFCGIILFVFLFFF